MIRGFTEDIEPGKNRKFLDEAEDNHFTGRMIFRRGQQSCAIFFADGSIIHARTNSPEHRIGEVLKRTRGLSDDSLNMALSLSKVQRMPLGLFLLGQDLISPRDLYQALVEQVALIVRDLVEWDAGRCYSHSDITPGEEVVLLKVSPEKALTRKARPVEAEPEGGKPPSPGKAGTFDQKILEKFLKGKESLAEDDYYGLLDLKVSVEDKEIKSAYQKLVFTWHPDKLFRKVPDELLARLQTVFSRINAAYSILGDAKSRKSYDDEQKKVPTRAARDESLPPRVEARRLYNAATSAMRRGHSSLAVDYLNKACQLDPGEAKYHYYLSSALFQGRKNLKKAEKALLRAIELDSSQADYYFALGRVYRAGRLFHRAREMFKETLSWDPLHRKALEALEDVEKGRDEEE